MNDMSLSASSVDRNSIPTPALAREAVARARLGFMPEALSWNDSYPIVDLNSKVVRFSVENPGVSGHREDGPKGRLDE
jgi:hypothetical protein